MDIVAFFLVLSHLATAVLTSEVPCKNSVDISDGQIDGTSIIKDGITYDENNYYRNGTEVRGCICNIKKCIRRCCADGEVLNLTSRGCVSAQSQGLSDFDLYYIVNVPDNQICEETKYRVKVEENFSVERGVLTWDTGTFEMEEYCVDEVQDTKVALVCVAEDSENDRLIVVLGMIISMPFLLTTLIVYALLPESNLHRKALMVYVTCLLASYIALVAIQLNSNYYAPVPCRFLGYSVIFFFVGSFFWMNVMCIDMWLAFSGMRGFTGQRNAERKRFLLYCLYAIGMPAMLTIMTILLDEFGDENNPNLPGVGRARCFVDDGLPTLYYFYGPVALITIFNIVLFILTAVKIRRVKQETSLSLKHSDSKRHAYEDDKQKFNLYLKLLFAMGINWSMETISWAVQWKTNDQVPGYIWYLTDFCNAMYGVFIFFIFVFKKKIWRNLQKRYYLWIGKPHLAHSLTTTQTTRSISTTDTGVTEHPMRALPNDREERPLKKQY